MDIHGVGAMTDHIGQVVSRLFDRHGLPALIRDAESGQVLEWDPELRAYDASGPDVLPAFFVRSHFSRRFFEHHEVKQLEMAM